MPRKQGGGSDFSGGISTATAIGSFRMGDRVPESGVYSCMPCGSKRDRMHVYTTQLAQGDPFPACPGCGENGLWERAHSRGR